MVPDSLHGCLLERFSLKSWLEVKPPDWEELEDILQIIQLQSHKLSLFKATLIDESPLPYLIYVKFGNYEQNE